VTSLRSHHKIPVHRSAENGIEPWLNLTKAGAHLGVNAKTLRIAAESAEIEALHPLPPSIEILTQAAASIPVKNEVEEPAPDRDVDNLATSSAF
jgi:hypothetical protein